MTEPYPMEELGWQTSERPAAAGRSASTLSPMTESDPARAKTILHLTEPTTGEVEVIRPGIVDFLAARYDEIEAAARAVQPLDWTDADGWIELAPEVAHHARLHSPGDVLDDIAAKRLIVAEYIEADGFYAENRDAPAGEVHGLATAVRHLAAPFRAHPDFDPAWAVE